MIAKLLQMFLKNACLVIIYILYKKIKSNIDVKVLVHDLCS